MESKVSSTEKNGRMQLHISDSLIAQDAQQSCIATGEELDLSLAIDIMRRHFETFDNRIASSSLGIDSWITLALSPMGKKKKSCSCILHIISNL